jgi:hypothetical protein
MKTYSWRESPCPNCGKRIDAATPVKEIEPPRPGDYSICFYCGEWLIFTETGVRVASEDDIREMSPQNFSLLERLRKALKRFKVSRSVSN